MVRRRWLQLPQLRGKVAHWELGTPLTSEYYLAAHAGASYGLAHTPARFRVDWLRPATPVPGLLLTGQDISTAGVAGAAIGGLLTVMGMSPRLALANVGLLMKGSM